MSQNENIIPFNLDKPTSGNRIEGELAKLEITYLEANAVKDALVSVITYLQTFPDTQLFSHNTEDTYRLRDFNKDMIILLVNVLAKLNEA